MMVVVAGLLAESSVTLSQDSGSPTASCEAFAPMETKCSGGTIVTFDATFRLGILLPPCQPGITTDPCYVGDIQLVLDYGFSERRLTCSVIALPGLNPDLLCAHSGQLALNREGTLSCYSRVYATADSSVEASGVPGGVGPWGCFVSRFGLNDGSPV